MKKSYIIIAIIFSLFSLALSSCEKDDNNSPTGNTESEGTYKVVMDGNTVVEGTATKVIFYAGELQVQDSNVDLVITMNEVPDTIDGVNSFEGTGRSQFQLSGKNLLESGEDESYFGFTGAVTRTSATKISFEGSCAVKPSAEMHTFSGYVESDSFKVK